MSTLPLVRAILSTIRLGAGEFEIPDLRTTIDVEEPCSLVEEAGLVPLIWNAPSPAATRDAYLSLYVREEVQSEGMVRDLGSFARFTESMSFCHAGVPSIATVARECEVKRKTVEGYIEILEDLLLAFRLPVFSRKAKRQLTAHPKFY